MRRKLLFLLSFFLMQLLAAQQLVIEVTTDKYPQETSWKLYNSNKEIVGTNGELLMNTTHRDTILLDPSQCYFWTIYDEYGDGMSNEEHPGSYTIYLDNLVVATCANPNFGDSISVYGLGNGCTLFDVALDELTFAAVQAFNPFDLTFNMVNFGSVPVYSIDVEYTLNNQSPVQTTLTFDSVFTGQTASLRLSEKIQISSFGVNEIYLEIIKVNGETDQNTGNNALLKTIEVKNGYWRKPLYEQFTSSTCAPCAIANKVNVSTFAQYPGQFSLIKYQVNFPGNGDPYYTNEVGYMRNSYEVNAVPTMFVDAVNIDPALTPDVFETYLGKITYGFLQVSAHLVGDSIFAEVRVTSSKSLSDPTFVRVAVVETETEGNVATNGENTFENVFMKFVSNKQGTSTGYLNANVPVNLSFKSSLSGTHVEELDDLKLVAYLFYDNEYQVIQSEMIDIPYAPAPPYFTANIEDNQTQVDTNLLITIACDKAIDTSALSA